MSVFIPYDVHALHNAYATLQGRLNALATAYASFPYKTKGGTRYAHHGFLRRFNTMHHCVGPVFEILPPGRKKNRLSYQKHAGLVCAALLACSRSSYADRGCVGLSGGHSHEQPDCD